MLSDYQIAEMLEIAEKLTYHPKAKAIIRASAVILWQLPEKRTKDLFQKTIKSNTDPIIYLLTNKLINSIESQDNISFAQAIKDLFLPAIKESSDDSFKSNAVGLISHMTAENNFLLKEIIELTKKYPNELAFAKAANLLSIRLIGEPISNSSIIKVPKGAISQLKKVENDTQNSDTSVTGEYGNIVKIKEEIENFKTQKEQNTNLDVSQNLNLLYYDNISNISESQEQKNSIQKYSKELEDIPDIIIDSSSDYTYNDSSDYENKSESGFTKDTELSSDHMNQNEEEDLVEENCIQPYYKEIDFPEKYLPSKCASDYTMYYSPPNKNINGSHKIRNHINQDKIIAYTPQPCKRNSISFGKAGSKIKRHSGFSSPKVKRSAHKNYYFSNNDSD